MSVGVTINRVLPVDTCFVILEGCYSNGDPNLGYSNGICMVQHQVQVNNHTNQARLTQREQNEINPRPFTHVVAPANCTLPQSFANFAGASWLFALQSVPFVGFEPEGPHVEGRMVENMASEDSNVPWEERRSIEASDIIA